MDERFEKLQKNLESVKNLDQSIVSEELAKAKSANPIPENVKLTIAKSSNIAPDKIDEAIKKNDNPQITNLVDTYYLTTNPKIQLSIEQRLSPEKKRDANIAFQELRASARDF